MGTEFQFVMIKKLWKWVVIMAAQQCNVLNATEPCAFILFYIFILYICILFYVYITTVKK